MLLIDDILLLPFRGVMWCAKEIHRAAEEAVADEGDSIRAQLVELYMRLETGRMSETEFDAQEKQLLDRFDSTEHRGDRVLRD